MRASTATATAGRRDGGQRCRVVHCAMHDVTLCICTIQCNARYGVMVANYGGPMRLFEAGADGRTVLDRASEAGVGLTTGGRALVSGPIISSRTDIFANNEGYTGGGRRLRAERRGAHP